MHVALFVVLLLAYNGETASKIASQVIYFIVYFMKLFFLVSNSGGEMISEILEMSRFLRNIEILSRCYCADKSPRHHLSRHLSDQSLNSMFAESLFLLYGKVETKSVLNP